MDTHWTPFATYSNVASAEAMAGRLRGEGVPVQIQANEPVPGLTYEVKLLVPSHLVHRACYVLAQAQFSEEELAHCALNAIDDAERSEQQA